MRTKIVKLAAIAALVLAALFWRSTTANYQLPLSLIVSMAALVVAVQAVQAKKYGWVVGFVAIALLFNPAVPVFGLTGELSRLLVLACIAPFAISWTALPRQPLLSIPSITDRTPGSQSL